jgi:hypothetical protein
MKQVLRRNNRIARSIALTISSLSGIAWAQTTTFTLTYTGQGLASTSCNTSFSIDGVKPSAPGSYPVFLYFVGTTETFNNASATAAIEGMAARGFVAATVQYDSTEFGSCSEISGKSSCAFNPKTSTSAISQVCAEAGADCAKGVVVGGFSQGAVIGTLAKNFNSEVQAVWGMGDGVTYAGTNLAACMANGNRTLPSDRLRAVNGVHDEFTGQIESLQQSNMQSLTGFDCATGSPSCLQRNGSGWIIVQDNQTESGLADHCYMRDGGCVANEDSLDSGWKSGTADWELGANLKWLTGFVTPGSAATTSSGPTATAAALK